ncbi:Eukaryotic initiation factor 4A-II [Sparganum proliferum]
MEDTSEVESNYTTVCKSFEDMCLQENLLRGIFAYGFEKPSAIQQRAIVPTIEGRDVIAQAQSGTGKTATFSIGLLQKIDTNLPHCQALVLAPTRELAKQIQKVVLALGDYMDVSCHVCIGGTQVNSDIEKLRAGQHVLVGTPGRVLDLLHRGALQTNYIRVFVLDEADEMLSLGFKDQIQEIISAMPGSVQASLVNSNPVSSLSSFFFRSLSVCACVSVEPPDSGFVRLDLNLT